MHSFLIIAAKRLRSLRWEYYKKLEEKRVRQRIHNDNFTLISQNCAGGVMYNLLGKRFDSPTINLFIIQSDFCKFCSDLNYYMNQELHFYKNTEDTRCPYAYLGNGDKRITIQFTHYRNEEEARTKWNERKKRIHWDNLYIIMNDGNHVTEDELKLLENAPCKRKIVFTSKAREEINDSFVLHTLKQEESAGTMQLVRNRWTGYRSWQQEFDYPAWLNGEENYRLNS